MSPKLIKLGEWRAEIIDKTIISTNTPEIPGYEVIRPLGEGGMAKVYLAHDTEYHDRPVAVKLLAKELAQDPQYVARFLDEVRTIGKLEHPAITRVYKHGEHNGQLYLIMQLLPGGELGEHIEKTPLAPERALGICRTVADALGFAHNKGVFHRDVKPENILFDGNNNPMLADFGIARDTSKMSGLTQGFVIGTPPYMSPEQMSGSDIDGRSDLYSLGIVLFEMLTGTKAFRGMSTFGSILAAKVSDDTLTLPKELGKYQPLLNRFLAPEPEDRYQTAEEACTALDSAMYPEPKSEPFQGKISAAIFAIALIGLGLSFYQTFNKDKPTNDASNQSQLIAPALRTILDVPLSVDEFHRYQNIASSKSKEDAQEFISKHPNTTLSVLLELMVAEPENAKQKLKEIETAAQAGSTGALIVLGELFTLDWTDLELNPELALTWSGRAAASGSDFGRYAYAMLQLEADQNSIEAMELLEQVANDGFFLAENLLGSMLLGNGSNMAAQQEGFAWLQKAADKGYREAIYNLAVAYYTGTGTSPDQEKAMALFERAAGLGDAEAQAILADNSE